MTMAMTMMPTTMTTMTRLVSDGKDKDNDNDIDANDNDDSHLSGGTRRCGDATCTSDGANLPEKTNSSNMADNGTS